MDSVDSRFHFFSTHVAQLSVFRTDRVLFKELKRGVVQQFMDRLRAACEPWGSRYVLLRCMVFVFVSAAALACFRVRSSRFSD